VENLNMPIYRAKKIDSDEYIEGDLIQGSFIFKEWINDVWSSSKDTRTNKAEVYKIDPTTLAIHFPDMLDSQGNKIFASLSEDGKGGDIIQLEDIIKTVIYDKKIQAIMLNSENTGLSMLSLYKNDIKTIGIQQ
jgi:hypothetical protein